MAKLPWRSHAHHRPLHFLPIGKQPWDSISMDFIKGLPLSDSHDMILVILDCLTKMALFIPTFSNIDSREVVMLFLHYVFAKHGTPSDIISDQGKHFTSWFWTSLCEILNIKRNLSTAYHPQTDGQTEQVNQTLEQYLHIYINYQQDNWANLLPLAEFTYNNTAHLATQLHCSLQIRASTQNSKYHSLWSLWKMLTISQQISRTFTSTFKIKSRNQLPSTPHPLPVAASKFLNSRWETRYGLSHEIFTPNNLQRSSTTEDLVLI